MTFEDLVHAQKGNEEKYNFVIFYNGIDVINTVYRYTFRELHSFIGYDLKFKKIEVYKEFERNIIHITLKG